MGDERGFTMVELLVVLVITAVLASIALAQYSEARARAQDREAMAAARTAHVALELRHQDENDYAATREDLFDREPTLRSARDLRLSTTAETFELSVESRSGARGGGRFSIARDADGRITRSCQNSGHGACRPGGEW